jgi:hypothetical protein
MSLPWIEQPWTGLADDTDLALLAGDHLLHTDLNPDNILISDGRAWLVDWAWTTLGAAWIDPACAGTVPVTVFLGQYPAILVHPVKVSQVFWRVRRWRV